MTGQVEEVLLRLARSPHAGDLVLRGGVLTRVWVGEARRETRDLDFLGLFPRDLDEAARRLADVLAIDSLTGVLFGLETLRGEVIWRETAFPGLRFSVEARRARDVSPPVGAPVTGGLTPPARLQIDIGFGDPLVPPAAWLDYPTASGPARLLAARPELLAAWKLDGLFEHGARRWQPKDLFDLHLLTAHCHLDTDTLVEAIRVAFEAHSDPLTNVRDVVYNPAWWRTDSARAKWAKYRAASAVPVPEEVGEVAAAVARALRPAVGRLIDLPPEGVTAGR
ncbi:MAG: nucleotidyl transferase AbiEii/AbiGii toxin family protein [Gemmataceae bacterium]